MVKRTYCSAPLSRSGCDVVEPSAGGAQRNMIPRMEEAAQQCSLGGTTGAIPACRSRPQNPLGGRNGVRYVVGESVTHLRLPMETNKSPAAIGPQGMIASPYKQGNWNQLVVRRSAFRRICRSDLLSGSTVTSVIRSEIFDPWQFYAVAATCQLCAQRLILSYQEPAACGARTDSSAMKAASTMPDRASVTRTTLSERQ